MWEPDVKLYAFLLCLAALLLGLSLATVSPQEAYIMTQNELRILLEISETLKENSETLKAEANSWKLTSEQLEIELESSTVEITNLRGELSRQRPRLTELGNMLDESQKQAALLAASARELGMRASGLENSIILLGKDLFRAQKSRDRWRLAALVAVGIVIIEGIIIALK